MMFLLSSFTASLLNDGTALIFSIDAEWGCFGFLNPQHFGTNFLLQGIFSGFWGGFGLTISCFFHSPLMTQNFILVVPIIAEIGADIKLIDTQLTFLSFVGASLVIMGSLEI